MSYVHLIECTLLGLTGAYPALVAALALVVAVRVRDARPLLWPLHAGFEVLLWALGWALVVPATWRGAYRIAPNDRFPGRLLKQFRWRLLWLWGNEEDGVDGLRGGVDQQAWAAQTAALSEGARVRRWSCWRNPCGNLRFVPGFSFQITPARVRSIGTSTDPDGDHAFRPNVTAWFYAWHGAYSGLWVNWPRLQLRVGWKLMPLDHQGLAPGDYRARGCAFGFQAHRL